MIRTNTLVAVSAAALLPVGYIVKRHVDWKKKPDSKQRMLIHHLTFWSAALAALAFLHNTLRFHRRKSLWRFKLPRFLAAGLLMVGGFEGGERLARFLIPKKAPEKPAQSVPPQTAPLPLRSMPAVPLMNTPSPFVMPRLRQAASSTPFQPSPVRAGNAYQTSLSSAMPRPPVY